MKVRGYFKGKFIAQPIKERYSNKNTAYQFKISHLEGIQLIHANSIDEQMYHTAKQAKGTFNHIELNEPVQIPLIENPFAASRIEDFNFFNIKIHKTQRISKGYYIEFFKGFKLFDSIFSLLYNCLVFVPGLLYNKRNLHLTDEVYLGLIEAEFIGNAIPMEIAVDLGETTDDEIISESDLPPLDEKDLGIS